MAKSKAPKSWAEQLAALDDPAPKELDPEDGHDEAASDSYSGSEQGPGDGREHYVEVGKSKLREQNAADLGPQYTGASISRDALLEADAGDDPFGSHSEREEDEGDYADPDEDLMVLEEDGDEEIDSDAAFESGDEEKFEVYTFRGGRSLRQDEEVEASREDEAKSLDGEVQDEDKDSAVDGPDAMEGAAEEEEDDDDDDDSDHLEHDNEDSSAGSDSNDTSVSDEPEEPKADDRAALRKMMADEQKTVATSFSKAAKADIEKGRAIKHQRTTFDSLLNTRIKLQKALIATNSMSANTSTSTNHTEAINATETLALNLWDTLSALRSSLLAPNSKKRSFSTISTTPSSALWDHMQSQENSFLHTRRANLTKWSQKTNPVTALPRANKFSQTPTQTPLTSVLDQQLSASNGEKLLNKTRIPRSCAPIQAAARIPEDPNIYDDADFYTLLLRELIDHRMADSSSSSSSNPAPSSSLNSSGNNALPSFPSQRDLKVKRQVDTKASKGRKMRYTVHEKLQNFMAPDDRGSWGERQRGELFESLLGRRVRLGEEEKEDEEDEVDGEVDEEVMEGGLRLFG